MSVYLNISELLIEFDTRYPEYVRERCKGYVVENCVGADLSLTATEENIRKANRDNVGLKEAELYAMTIPLSERMPMMSRIMTHGVAIACDGRSYIFTAESGVGKSTHAFLWQRYLGEERVEVINGDKPIIWFKEDGTIVACGSPWSGKEHLDRNVCVPLGGVCLLKRLGDDPRGPHIERASRGETLDFLMRQVFIPESMEAKVRTFGMIDALYEKVPVYNLTVDMSREAVRVSSECLLKVSSINSPII